MNATLLLVIATLALVGGPLLDRVGRRFPAFAAIVDGATVGGIVAVAFVHLLPEAGVHLGWWVVALFGLGLMLPTLGERLLVHGSHGSWRSTVGGLVIVLLLLHEVIESAALASKAYDERISLATLLVVVGHRLPLGVFLWGHARRRFGLVWSVAVLASVALASLCGPLLVPERFRHGQFSAVLSALLAGGLLHLVLQHQPTLGLAGRAAKRGHAWSALGAIAAVAFFVPYLMGVDSGHGHAHSGALVPLRLWDLVLETSVPLSIGVLGAALIEVFMPGSVASWLARGSRLRQALAGVAVGAPMPVCSCGVLPIYRSLISKGVPAGAALALLVSAPEIGIDSIFLSLEMLGGVTTLARVGCALTLALVIGLWVGRQAQARPLCLDGPLEELGGRARGWQAVRRGLLETWGHLAPWILLGLLATALVEPWISAEWAAALPRWSQVLVLTAAGLPSYICATAATPFAALLLSKGFSTGAVVAFLLTGPATNLTTFGALARMHSRRVAWSFVWVALGVTICLGHALDRVLAWSGSATGVRVLEHAEDHHEVTPLRWLAVGFLLALTIWVLAREGPRAFLAQLWPEDSHARSGTGHSHDDPPRGSGHEHHHENEHGRVHGHEHGPEHGHAGARVEAHGAASGSERPS